jgi:hypothetical protein
MMPPLSRLCPLKCSQNFVFSTALIFLATLLTANGIRAEPALQLESATPFAVLAGAGITITGPTTITGDIGTFPTPSITGLENLTINGVNHADDLFTQSAKTDLFSAYNDAVSRTPTTTYAGPFDLGGQTLLPGVYNSPSSFALTGILTLDAQGDPNAVWIFQADSTLTTAVNSTVNLFGGASATNIFWQVGSSATLGVNSDFAGSILALQSITANTGSIIDGGLYAVNGAVTLDSNTISVVPEPGSALLIGASLALFAAKRHRTWKRGIPAQSKSDQARNGPNPLNHLI